MAIIFCAVPWRPHFFILYTADLSGVVAAHDVNDLTCIHIMLTTLSCICGVADMTG